MKRIEPLTLKWSALVRLHLYEYYCVYKDMCMCCVYAELSQNKR